MARKILGVLVDVDNKKFQAIEVEDTLDNLYGILNCSCIDIVHRRIGGYFKKTFDIVCDDEGTFRDDPYISAVDNLGRTQLVGNIFIVGPADEEGNLTSLTEYDVAYIESKIIPLATRKHPTPYPILTQCNY